MRLIYIYVFASIFSVMQANTTLNAEQFAKALQSENQEEIISFFTALEISSLDEIRNFSEEMLFTIRETYGVGVDKEKFSHLIREIYSKNLQKAEKTINHRKNVLFPFFGLFFQDIDQPKMKCCLDNKNGSFIEAIFQPYSHIHSQIRDAEDLPPDFYLGVAVTVAGAILVCVPHPAATHFGSGLITIGTALVVSELRDMEKENRETQAHDPTTIPDPFGDGRFNSN